MGSSPVLPSGLTTVLRAMRGVAICGRIMGGMTPVHRAMMLVVPGRCWGSAWLDNIAAHGAWDSWRRSEVPPGGRSAAGRLQRSALE